MRYRDNYINIVTTAWKKDSCEKLIIFLESINFRFVEYDHINQNCHIPGLPESHYTFMVRIAYLSKKPTRDIHDYNLIFGIDLINRDNQIYIWLGGAKYKRGRKKWLQKNLVNFKPKKKGTKYPDWMSIQDRIDYRRIERKLLNRGITKEEELFFNKCYPAVKEVNTPNK